MGRIIFNQFYYSPLGDRSSTQSGNEVEQIEIRQSSYSDSQCGYTFEYPKEWQRSATENVVVLSSYQKIDRPPEADEVKILVNCRQMEVESQSKMLDKLTSRYGDSLPPIERVEIAERPAWKQKFPPKQGGQEFYIFNRKGKVVVISIRPAEAVEKKEVVRLLKTFRF